MPSSSSSRMVWDRHIPVRSAIDWGFALTQLTSAASSSTSSPSHPRILAFNNTRRGGEDRDYASFFLFAPSPSHHRRYYRRRVSEREKRSSTILSAPDLLADDLSLNLLDWGSNSGAMAMALGSTLYVWNASSSGSPSSHLEFLSDEPISSVAWAPDGRRIAVGLEGSQVQVWEPTRRRLITTLNVGGDHRCHIGSLAWDGGCILTTGGGDGCVVDHDIRVPFRSRAVHTYMGHRPGRGERSICGLRWSDSCPKQLASGGLDGLVRVWDRRMGGQGRWVHRFGDHTTPSAGAVRALAWSPSHYRLLATGSAGEAEGCIEFWNTESGTRVRSVHVGSQVFGLMWGRDSKEILSSSGAGDLTLWAYPEMVRTAKLVGHTHWVLYMAQSPDGCGVATASADETLRMWWDAFSPREVAAAGLQKKIKPAHRVQPQRTKDLETLKENKLLSRSFGKTLSSRHPERGKE